MIIRQESGDRWLPVRIDDVEKWQASLLEEPARRLGAVLAPGGRVHRWGFVGSPVTFRGQRAWLRVSPERLPVRRRSGGPGPAVEGRPRTARHSVT